MLRKHKAGPSPSHLPQLAGQSRGGWWDSARLPPGGPGGLCAVTNTPCHTWVNVLNQEEKDQYKNLREKPPGFLTYTRDKWKRPGTSPVDQINQTSWRNGIFWCRKNGFLWKAVLNGLLLFLFCLPREILRFVRNHLFKDVSKQTWETVSLSGAKGKLMSCP